MLDDTPILPPAPPLRRPRLDWRMAARMVGRLRAEVAEQLATAMAEGNARVLLWLADRLGLARRELSPPAFDVDAFRRRERLRKRKAAETGAAEQRIVEEGLPPGDKILAGSGLRLSDFD